MDIILKKSVDNLGDAHEVVTVKPGYARNYLIPRGFAVAANAANMAELEEIREKQAAEKEALLKDYYEIKDKLTAEVVRVGAKVGTSEKIFGSVTTHLVAEAIKQQMGVDLDHKVITLPEDEVKTLGAYKASLALQEDVVFDIDFEVAAE